MKTWHGANNGRFVSNLEGQLPTAREYAKDTRRERSGGADMAACPRGV